jgi:hypothetical protein
MDFLKVNLIFYFRKRWAVKLGRDKLKKHDVWRDDIEDQLLREIIKPLWVLPMVS